VGLQAWLAAARHGTHAVLLLPDSQSQPAIWWISQVRSMLYLQLISAWVLWLGCVSRRGGRVLAGCMSYMWNKNVWSMMPPCQLKEDISFYLILDTCCRTTAFRLWWTLVVYCLYMYLYLYQCVCVFVKYIQYFSYVLVCYRCYLWFGFALSLSSNNSFAVQPGNAYWLIWHQLKQSWPKFLIFFSPQVARILFAFFSVYESIFSLFNDYFSTSNVLFVLQRAATESSCPFLLANNYYLLLCGG